MLSIASDLHLDFKNDSQITKVIKTLIKDPEGDLIIAGDVASLHTVRGLRCWNILYSSVMGKFENVFIVLGNHEHYFGDIAESPRVLRENFPRFTLLDRDVWQGRKYSIAGCTLWSEIPDPQKSILEVNTLMNCYLDGKFFTPEKYNELHRIDTEWLQQQKVDIVVTHYPPTFEACDHKKKGNQYFCSNNDSLLKGNKLWICGHTHVRKDFYSNGCRVILNCIGHRKEYGDFSLKKLNFSS